MKRAYMHTYICAALIVETLPSLLNSDSSWLRVTNSASIATSPPFIGISSCERGLNVIRFLPLSARLLSSKNT